MKTKEHKEVTDRFQTAIFDVIKRNKLAGKDITSTKAFAEAIGQTPQNFSKFSRKQQMVSMPIVIAACKKFKISPNYLILGIGEMYLTEDVSGKTDQLEERIKRLEKMLSPDKPRKLRRV